MTLSAKFKVSLRRAIFLDRRRLDTGCRHAPQAIAGTQSKDSLAVHSRSHNKSKCHHFWLSRGAE